MDCDVDGGHHPALAVADSCGDRPDARGEILVGEGPAPGPHLAQRRVESGPVGLPAGVMPERPGTASSLSSSSSVRAASSTLPIEVAVAGKRVPMVTASVMIFGTATRVT
ncbi:hypothetical protein GCM10029963_07680 [Micromonospora andamanensis]